MYSRIARAKFDTSKSAEVIKVAKEGVAAHQKLAGFQSVAYHYDRVSGWGISVGVFDTKAHADAANEGLRSIAEAFAPFRSNQQLTPDTLEGALSTFEVVAQG